MNQSSGAVFVPRMTARSFFIVVLLCIAGFLGNWFKFQLFFNVDFLFGSFFVMLAIVRFGIPSSVVAALIASGCTQLLWNHPWAIVIFTVEALFVALGNRRKPGNLVIWDTLYWIFIGAPLVWFFYHVVMGMGLQATLLVALKQSINGIYNALFATFFIYAAQYLKFKKGDRNYSISFQNIIFTTLLSVTLLPAALYLIRDVNQNMKEQESRALLRIQLITGNTQEILNNWITGNQRTVTALADLVADPNAASLQLMQKHVIDFRLANPNFMRLGVVDKHDVIAAFSAADVEDGKNNPALGLDLSNRPYVSSVKQTLKPFVSDVFMGKIGAAGPRISIVIPIVKNNQYNGYCFGAVELQRLAEQLGMLVKNRATDIILLDREGKVIVSSSGQWSPMQKFGRSTFADIRNLPDGVRHWIPKSGKNISLMQRWKNSLLIKEVSLSRETPWTIVVETSMKPYLGILTQKTIDAFLWLWGVTLLALVVSHFLSRLVLDSLSRLNLVTAQLPRKLADGEEPRWPESGINELRSLVANFQEMGDALGGAFKKFVELNQALELRVAERTRDLQTSRDALHEQTVLLEQEAAERQMAQEALVVKQLQLEELNHVLEERIAQSVSELRQKDQLMINQNRLAAMGEMIGNIAHQWRQPLNALGLLLFNIKDAYEYKELDAKFMDQAVADGTRMVQKMSATINDFRNFFRPDKEKSSFSMLKQINDAISLVDMSFKNDNVAISLDAGDDVILNGYPNEYSQVMLNLFANAREAIVASGAAGGKIEVKIKKNGGQGSVTIRDNGGGIPAESMDRIFEPYFSTKKMGTGIGLYMSKMIIERNMNGRLEAKNVEGGASFTVLLPLAGTPDSQVQGQEQ